MEIRLQCPFVLQALVNDILSNRLNWFVFIFLDDSLSPQEHLLHVRPVLQRLLVEKCKFHRSTIPCLGSILSAVQRDPDKVNCIGLSRYPGCCRNASWGSPNLSMLYPGLQHPGIPPVYPHLYQGSVHVVHSC